MAARRSLLIWIMLAGMAAGSACSRPAELTGQVFVVTKGRDNVKLGAIQVSAVPETKLNAFTERRTALLTEYADTVKRWWPCKDLMDRVQGPNAAEGKEYDAVWAKYERQCAGLEAFENTKFGRDTMRISEIAEGGPFFEAFPAGEGASARTDADGRYSLPLTRGERYAVAASAERAVPGQEKPEQYRWLLWVRVDEARKELHLSNDNMMPQRPKDAVVDLPKCCPPARPEQPASN